MRRSHELSSSGITDKKWTIHRESTCAVACIFNGTAVTTVYSHVYSSSIAAACIDRCCVIVATHYTLLSYAKCILHSIPCSLCV
jgi:hypothetical protein